MKTQTIILKEANMLCHRCVMNVVGTLSQISGIKELKVDLETHYIKLKYINSSFPRELVKRLIKESIEGGRYIGVNGYNAI